MPTVAEQLRAFEEALLDPAVRRDRAAVLDLLSEEFREFGSSGRVWTRDQIAELLAKETSSPVSIEDFHCDVIAEEVALVTYRAVRTDRATGTPLSSLRSSVWVNEENRWRVRFHQGTRIG